MIALKDQVAGSRTVHADLTEALLLHPWPLNVRGLLNVITVASIASPDVLRLGPEVRDALEADRLLVEESAPFAATAPEADTPTPERSGPPSRDQLHEAMARAEGSVAAVARFFGASRQQIYRWLRHHGLEVTDYRG